MSCCLACGIQRPARQYLCNSCWFALPEETRERLTAVTGVATARDRLFQLLSAIRRGVPLDRIRVSGDAMPVPASTQA